VFFRSAGEGVRSFAPARLPEHETVYAMTIHKAQGSEFGDVLMVLPNELSPIMSRELVYTGITRAMARVEIWGARRRSARRWSGGSCVLRRCANGYGELVSECLGVASSLRSSQ
jgi:ATP-dependent exoDNAse (exonuclease V) alpha subunit